MMTTGGQENGSAKASAGSGLGGHNGVPRTPTLTLAAGTPAEQLERLTGRTLLCHQDVLGPFDQRRGFQPGSAEHPDMDGQRLHRAPVRIRADRRFGSPRLLRSLIPGTSLRFVRVRSYDRPDRSIVMVLLETSM